MQGYIGAHPKPIKTKEIQVDIIPNGKNITTIPSSIMILPILINLVSSNL